MKALLPLGWPRPWSCGPAIFAAAVVAILLATGCGEEPGPEDLLTLVELDSNPAPPDSTLVARARVSFRDWFNGGIVIEKRVGSTGLVTGLAALLEGTEEEQAEAWALVMAGSASAGLAEQLVVGYQGLIRDIELELPGCAIANDSTSTFLVAYLADIEEIEIDGQPDSLVITPYGIEQGILNDVAVLATLVTP
jgi:hypothetical protein